MREDRSEGKWHLLVRDQASEQLHALLGQELPPLVAIAEPHPHVHVILKTTSEQGERLNIKKAQLEE